MKLWLEPHPQSSETPLVSFRAYVSRIDDTSFRINFCPAGAMDRIAWPGEAMSGQGDWDRADDLWLHTCFEAFGRIEGQPGYFELNFATGGKWAAYGFLDYREGMYPAEDFKLQKASWRIRERQAELNVVLRVPYEFARFDWHVGLSAVIESKSGVKSYWALAHPLDKPDFHDPACFTATLPAPRAE